MPFIRLETESAECSCLCLLQPFLKWQATNPKTQLSTRQRHKRHSINLMGEMSKWFHRLQGWHCKCTSLSINGRKKQSSPVYVHKTTEQKLSNPSSNNCRLGHRLLYPGFDWSINLLKQVFSFIKNTENPHITLQLKAWGWWSWQQNPIFSR